MDIIILFIFFKSFFQAEVGSESLLYLKGYCYMHRLFLQFLTVYPELKEKAKNVLTQFIGDPSARHIDVSYSHCVSVIVLA